jgi:uncharacterized membrane protein YqgA involved in biofilm formation
MIGTIVNTLAVIAGGSIGLLVHKKLSDNINKIYFQAIGLVTIALGINMVWNIEKVLPVVLSIVLGAITGELLSLEKKVDKIGDYLKIKLKTKNERFTEGLVTSFLLFCIGSMTIVGAIQEGTGGSSDLLFTKSVMDFFSAMLLATGLGLGVIVSSIPLFLFQGGITLVAMLSAQFLNEDIILGLTNVGGILLIGLGVNILEIKKLSILNMIPSLLYIIILLLLFG